MELPDAMLLRTGQVLAYLGVNRRTLEKFVAAGHLKPIRLRDGETGERSGCRFFRRAEVVKFAEGGMKGDG